MPRITFVREYHRHLFSALNPRSPDNDHLASEASFHGPAETAWQLKGALHPPASTEPELGDGQVGAFSESAQSPFTLVARLDDQHLGKEELQMNRKEKPSTRSSVMKPFFVILLFASLWASTAGAVSTLNLSWQDNSNDETGFNIERATTSAGPFTKVASLGPNVTAYSDANLAEAATFCYRTNAFNAAGASPYTNVVCGMTKATLALSKTGTGSGRISSQPAGLDCNVSCTMQFNGNSSVTLTATPAAGSVFTGWSGGCSGTASTCTVIMNRQNNVTANFDPTASSKPQSTENDYDGDGKTDLTSYTAGRWVVQDAVTGVVKKSVWTGELPGDIPVPADYDGDGKTDLALYRKGAWLFFNNATGAYRGGVWTGGVAGDLPIPADYDGDGKTDVAIFRGGAWLVWDAATGALKKAVWTGASPGDIPVPADYDGDGIAELSLYRKGGWLFFNNTTGVYIGGVWTGGVTADEPVPGDYDGDGISDIAIYRKGAWLVWDAVTKTLKKAVWTGEMSGDIPAPGDYNGDGIADFALYRNGAWLFFNNTTGAYSGHIWAVQ